MGEPVRQDDVGEYAVAYDDELVRCDARKCRKRCGGAGVGRLECSMEQDVRAEAMGNRFGLELCGVVAGACRVRDNEDAGGPKGTQGLGPGDLHGSFRVSGRRLIKLLYEGRRTHFDFRNEVVAMREGLRGGSRESRAVRC